MYNPWEVEGNTSSTTGFYSSKINMQINDAISEIFDQDGVQGIKTKVPLDLRILESTQNLLRGPVVYQDQNYKTGDRFTAEYIPYVAKFRMKIGFKPDIPINIGTLRVFIKYPVNEDTYDSILLAHTRFNTNELKSRESRKIYGGR